MRDVLPEDFLLRDSLIAIIRGVYESYGYVSIDTPVPERLEYLTEKAGDDTEQLMFKILKRGTSWRPTRAKHPPTWPCGTI